MSKDLIKNLPDYIRIAPFLEADPENFNPEVNIPPFSLDTSTIVIVDNVPIVDDAKAPRLKKLLVKIYGKIAEYIDDNSIYFPFEKSTGLTPGFCFIKFLSKEDADTAVKVTNLHVLDKNHTFKVTLYSELARLNSISNDFVNTVTIPFVPRPDPCSWLNDEQCRDQFVIRHHHETEVYWGTHLQGQEPDLLYGGEREKKDGRSWCESVVMWSPKGSFLATFHPPGIKLWGGEKFEPQGRFMHTDVTQVDFSPCENYMTTYCTNSNSVNVNSKEAIIVWDIRSGEKLRTFALKDVYEVGCHVQVTQTEEKNGKKVDRTFRGKIEGDVNFIAGTCTIMEGNTKHTKIQLSKVTVLQDLNALKWSSDGRYLARLGVGIIQVYELPTMKLLENKSLAAKDVIDFVWSPTQSVLSYWSPADLNLPAIINIVDMPSRNTLCSRKVFDVQDGKIVWQNDGDYLCVHMTKLTGKKKSWVMLFFRVKENEIPVEIVELTEALQFIAWEPSGARVAVVHGEVRAPTVSFYTMNGAAATSNKNKTAVGGLSRNEVTNIVTLTGKQCTEIQWSPAGGVVAIAFIASDTCLFELYDVDNNVSMASRRHDRCNRLAWDPSGRILATCTLSPLRAASLKAQLDDGYNLYTFQGIPICQVRKEKLYQFAWRPRPQDILSDEDKKKVIKNYKKYEKIFEKEDRARKNELNAAVLQERSELATDFFSLLRRNRQLLTNGVKELRKQFRNGYDSDDDNNYQVAITHDLTIISTKEEIIG